MLVVLRGAVLAALLVFTLSGCSQAGASLLPTTNPDATADQTDAPTDAEETQPTETAPPPAETPTPSYEVAEVDLTRLATGESPAGWVEDLSNDGACRDAVPADWTRGVIQGIASTDFVQVILTNDAVTDFKAEVAHLKATYFGELNDSANVVLIEDDHVFVMRETVRGGASYVIALNGETTACGMIIQVEEVGADQYRDLATQLLYTLAEAK